MSTDYYDLLGVNRQATDDEIKRSYRRLARELHPDANGGDPESEERFKQVVVAYETLRDPERRRRYDMFGPEGPNGGRAGAEDVFGGGLGDIFDAFFGQTGFTRTQRAGPGRGADAEVALQLSFEEAVFGAEREVTVRGPVTCGTCGGSGAKPGTSATPCQSCSGTGEVRRVRQSILGQMVTASPCPACRGTGERIATPCPDCRGDGRRTEERTYNVEVPAGVDEGSTLRLTGRGPAGPRGGMPGDLYVHLQIRPHPRLRRSGHDLTLVEHIAMTQAALGADLVVETLDGDEPLAVPPGTQSGTVFRLRGRGVPFIQSRGRGDLLVEVVVDTPTELTATQDELLRQLAEERGEPLAEPEEGGLLHRIRSKLR